MLICQPDNRLTRLVQFFQTSPLINKDKFTGDTQRTLLIDNSSASITAIFWSPFCVSILVFVPVLVSASGLTNKLFN